ncbi:30S ribosomal protein S2 [Candidatus Nomurabacteria bacterium]|uniref:Small ribosomal subunit protein uS2 n=1 Tax=candidate division WWE3 bacterium TaxID=2053526 RepID=A0A955E0C5_UNCKA|nr:30S ribosomal protein S2 [candidate division WWE3 bacterium]MCB9823656.1 30S ribosomal protein S2 [Candidatus Nomurabacteria bacterium]MCB9827266.1 30S ribosomal protein S2 [Candidatus Nomurabacteria bacterium]MCB9827451.1 30S ribosomal protein S2 [Candidatus Nomurabacteria bacterium]HXK52864.1 30S ribosomal protein S2 [bacterium]
MSKPYKLPKVEDLFSAGVHFGHQVRRWNPAMSEYIYDTRRNVHIIDLQKTHAKLEEACDYLYDLASKGEKIIFVGTKRQAKEMLEVEAKRCGALFVSERWLGGIITNFQEVKKNIDRFLMHIRKMESGEYQSYTKKERLLIERKIEKLRKAIGGLVGLHSSPAALFVIDSKREKTAIREAKASGVKVVALVDTNSNPRDVDYVIPGNDDAIKSVALILNAVSDAIEAGYKVFEKDAAKIADEKKQNDSDKAKDEVSLDKVVPVVVTSTESPVASSEAGKRLIERVNKGDVSDLDSAKGIEDTVEDTEKSTSKTDREPVAKKVEKKESSREKKVVEKVSKTKAEEKAKKPVKKATAKVAGKKPEKTPVKKSTKKSNK